MSLFAPHLALPATLSWHSIQDSGQAIEVVWTGNCGAGQGKWLCWMNTSGQATPPVRQEFDFVGGMESSPGGGRHILPTVPCQR
jgi:hypothetical protein